MPSQASQARLGRGHARPSVSTGVLLQRPVDIVELIGGNHGRVGGTLRLCRPACRRLPAASCWPLPSWRWRCRRHLGGRQLRIGVGDGRRDRWAQLSPEASATSFSADFLGSRRISTPPCRICARSVSSDARSVLTDLPDVALSDFEVAAALSLLAATTGDGPAKHTKSPVATINAERPLALMIIGNLPICPPPKRNETPPRVHSAAEKGNLRARPGESRAACCAPMAPRFAPRMPVEWRAGASERDRCYEPAGAGTGCPDSRTQDARTGDAEAIDHDFVIDGVAGVTN